MWSILHLKYVSEHMDKMTCYARVPGGRLSQQTTRKMACIILETPSGQMLRS